MAINQLLKDALKDDLTEASTQVETYRAFMCHYTAALRLIAQHYEPELVEALDSISYKAFIRKHNPLI